MGNMNDLDLNRFSLSRAVETMVAAGECERIDAPIDLVDVAAHLDGNPKAVWLTAVGPERVELVGNVMGVRSRLALALGTTERELPRLYRERVGMPIAPIEIAKAMAPVQQVVLMGADADLTKLPVHLQHGRDSGPYISASLDFALDRATGWTNVGCRRIMVRGRHTAGIDLNAPSDLKAMYQTFVARGERMPLAYAVGCHPADFLASLAVNRSSALECIAVGSPRTRRGVRDGVMRRHVQRARIVAPACSRRSAQCDRGSIRIDRGREARVRSGRRHRRLCRSSDRLGPRHAIPR